MTVLAWPGFPVYRFEMRILRNQRRFNSPYSSATQVLDLLGERWIITMTLAPVGNDKVAAVAREAFWDRLQGQANLIAIGHQALKQPNGTLGGNQAAPWHTGSGSAAAWSSGGGSAAIWSAGAPIVDQDIEQLASAAVLRVFAGATLLAGDLINLGGTQLVRNLTDAAADPSGRMTINFQPRARRRFLAGSSVIYSSPTANFRLKPGNDGVPNSWTPGAVIDGATIELIEDIT